MIKWDYQTIPEKLELEDEDENVMAGKFFYMHGALFFKHERGNLKAMESFIVTSRNQAHGATAITFVDVDVVLLPAASVISICPEWLKEYYVVVRFVPQLVTCPAGDIKHFLQNVTKLLQEFTGEEPNKK